MQTALKGGSAIDLRADRSSLPAVALLGLALLGAVALTAGPARAQDRRPLDVKVFAKVGPPGHPDPVVVDTDGTVYVGTSTSFSSFTANSNQNSGPSKILVYGPDGKLKTSHDAAGQNLSGAHGLLGLVFDGKGLLYVTDTNPPRVFTLDPRTGEQRDYVRFTNVPVCSGAGQKNCQSSGPDRQPFPNGLAFAADGSLYVTDYYQGLVWRVPPGGGEPEVWFTDARLGGFPFGPNGIKLMLDGATLMVAQSNSASLLTLPILPAGGPGELKTFWTGETTDGPDSFAIARSGNVYVALAGASEFLKLSQDGKELARSTSTGQDVPWDVPADVGFLGERMIVTNSSFFNGNASNWALFDVFAGEPGLPAALPGAPGTVVPPPCVDSLKPQSTFTSRGVRIKGSKLILRGTSRDLGCSPTEAGQLDRILLSVALIRPGTDGNNCKFLKADGTFSDRRYCRRPALLLANGTTSWKYSIDVRLPRGSYRARVRAVDVARNKESPSRGDSVVVFRVP